MSRLLTPQQKEEARELLKRSEQSLRSSIALCAGDGEKAIFHAIKEYETDRRGRP